MKSANFRCKTSDKLWRDPVVYKIHSSALAGYLYVTKIGISEIVVKNYLFIESVTTTNCIQLPIGLFKLAVTPTPPVAHSA